MHKKFSALLSAVLLSASLHVQAQPAKKPAAAQPKKKAVGEKVYDNAHTPPKAPMTDAELWRYFSEKTGSSCLLPSYHLQCIVNTDGSLSEVKLKEKVSPECLKKVKQAAAGLPKWKPGRNAADKAIRVRYTVKIYIPVEAPVVEQVVAFPRESAANGTGHGDAGEDAFETRPEYPDQSNYIRQNLVYPEAALKAGTSGMVRLKLAIDTNGKVMKVLTLSELPNGCTEEAVRLAKNMPAWKPGTSRGKPTQMYAYMVVKFTLPSDYAPQSGKDGKAADTVKREGGLWGNTSHQEKSLPLPNKEPVPQTSPKAANSGIRVEPPQFPETGMDSFEITFIYRNKKDTAKKIHVRMPDLPGVSTEEYEFVERMDKKLASRYDLHQYLKDNLRYPQAAIDEGVQGGVIISFTVNEDGSLSGFRLEKSLSKECDEEALRLAKAMPKWKPGTRDGKPVRTRTIISVSFTLK